MTAFPCKTCGTEIKGFMGGIDARCSPCAKKRLAVERRILSFCLIPIWLPLMVGAMVVGILWAVIYRGFCSGMTCVKELADAWAPDA